MFIYRRALVTLPYAHSHPSPPAHTHSSSYTRTLAHTQSHTPALFAYTVVAPVKASIKSCTCSLKVFFFFLATHECFFDTLFCLLRGRYRRGKKKKKKPSFVETQDHEQLRRSTDNMGRNVKGEEGMAGRGGAKARYGSQS